MEPTEVKRGRGRPRKRRREEQEEEKEENEKKLGIIMKKQAFDLRWKPLVGRYVLKEFEGSGVFLGKVVYYDNGFYRVDYEDGDCEDFEGRELRNIVLWDNDLDDGLSRRKRKLDELVIEKSVTRRKELEKNKVANGLTGENGGMQGVSDGDSLDGSDEDEDEQDVDVDLEQVEEALVVPAPQLPPSSGTINVPEEIVAHLLSVYLFLRSFSVRLFLYPFSLDDFVGAVNYQFQNTLFDAIHVALLRALRLHLETISLDGSEVASKCLRCIDWSLLDSFTWPTYVVHYLTVIGYPEGPEWKGFYDDLLKREYYTIPVDRKIKILQLLCDDVLDSVELRVEIDIREESDSGLDLDSLSNNLPEHGPRRVHPRYSKTSACKRGEAMEIVADGHAINPSCSSKILGSGVTEGDRDTLNVDVDVDGNGDECRLCGMDGMLICCDGCPSAYHPRCVGLVKLQIPEGPWYCPECAILKVGPSITAGTSLCGAELFGIDPYEQVFLGTCDHLLVLSIRKEHCHRYYSGSDVPKVLQVLFGSTKHRCIYSGICNAIAHHWEIAQSCSSPLVMSERCLNLLSVQEDGQISSVSPSSCKKSHDGQDINNAFSLNPSGLNKVASSPIVPSVNIAGQADTQDIVRDDFVPRTQIPYFMSKTAFEHIEMESSGMAMPPVDSKHTLHQFVAHMSALRGLGTYNSANGDCSHMDLVNGSHLSSIGSSQSKAGNNGCFRRIKGDSGTDYLYIGMLFKPYSYINYYMHGDFAASAAAKLAVLSEESKVPEVYKSANGRLVASDILLQAKAFAAVASRFLWPSSEKKLVEVPRERCGWCHSCKQPTNSKKGCMLNAAALSATKGALKILSGPRPAMAGEGYLRSISAYLLYLEETLHGFTVGVFLNASYREQWRKTVEDASCYTAIKKPLLELEENVRIISLSGEWVKAMDDWTFDSSLIQIGPSISGTTQKSGPGGKLHRKPFGMADISGDDFDDKSFVWWRGGKLLKLMFHIAVLPQAMGRRAARQGGSRKISGIFYTDNSEVPKRSRRLVWRAAVEACKNTSRLAFQVRYLDFHVRWCDLVRAEQNLQDGKGQETDASVFRNAIICDKKMDGSKIIYGVDFQDQKHLPSRVMKTVIEAEENNGGKQKYWFWEASIPLYLIKEYEERLERVDLSSSHKRMSQLSKLQRKQLRDSRKDIFTYLVNRRDKNDKCSCASCQNDVLLKDTVVCNACQGYCHEACTLSSTVGTNEEVEFLITCEKCCNRKDFAHAEKINESPTTPLPLQVLGNYDAATVAKSVRHNVSNWSLVSVRSQESSSETTKATSVTSVTMKKSKTRLSEMQQATSASGTTTKKSRTCNWGLIWKKKREDTGVDTGIDFRRKNVLLKGSPDGSRLQPVCKYCGKEYNQELMYIHCSHCNNWFHAEAVELTESRLHELLSYKCCRCRRIRPPRCPYSDDPDIEKLVTQRFRKEKKGGASDSVNEFESIKHEFEEPVMSFDEDTVSYLPGSLALHMNAVEQGNNGAIANSIEYEDTTPMFTVEEMFVEDDDPLLFSLSRVENITENNLSVEYESSIAGLGPRKLPVRRQTKNQGEEGAPEDNLYQAETYVPVGADNMIDPKESTSCTQLDVSARGLQDDMQFDYGGNYQDMEFEPQTYFSFTELLESDDGAQVNNGYDVSRNGNNQLCTVADNGYPQQHAANAFGDCVEPAASLPFTNKPMKCEMCYQVEPTPDLSCSICGATIHRGCLPWIESPPLEGDWRCGRCRDWR